MKKPTTEELIADVLAIHFEVQRRLQDKRYRVTPLGSGTIWGFYDPRKVMRSDNIDSRTYNVFSLAMIERAEAHDMRRNAGGNGRRGFAGAMHDSIGEKARQHFFRSPRQCNDPDR